MNKVNVIDLDKTLIPYDSFRFLIIRQIYKLKIYIIYLVLLRIFRFLSSNTFKKKILSYFLEIYDDKCYNKYSKKLLNDIDKSVLDFIYSKTDNKTINVIISASPDIYVKRIIEKLNWQGSGSKFNNNVFCNLYSKNKIKWLYKNYPKEKFIYNFAISDSKSDLELLKLFNEYEILIR